MATITTRSGKGSALTHTELDNNFTNLNTDKVEASGDTITDNLDFNDNVKAQFGAGNDLQIYHDGSHSYIQDSGSGNLRILVGNLQIRNYGSNENVITSTSNAEVALYHNASQKLATTSTGVDVTGTLVSDGLTVDGAATISEGSSGASASGDSNTLVVENNGNSGMSILSPDGSNSQLRLGDVTDSSSGIVQYDSTNNIMTVGTSRPNAQLRFLAANSVERIRIISNGRVGIGNTEPASLLDVNGTVTSNELDVSIKMKIGGSTPRIELMESDTTDLNTRLRNTAGVLQIQTTTDDLLTNKIRLAVDHSNGEVAFYNTGGSLKKAVWDATNLRLGLNTATPARTLDVNGDAEMNNLYLSGGAYLGGTAGVNKLDHYEEGTWDPVVADAASGGNTGTATTIEGRFTRIGRQVTLVLKIEDIDTTGMTGANSLFIRGIPFAAGSGTTGQSQGACRLDRFNLDADCCGVVTSTTSNTSHLTLRQTIDNASDIQIKVQDVTSGSADLFSTITYFVS